MKLTALILGSLMSTTSLAKSIELRELYLSDKQYLIRSALAYDVETKKCKYIIEIYDNNVLNILFKPVSYRQTDIVDLELCKLYNLIEE